MSLREDMWKYEVITGESGKTVPLVKLGAFLDGYDAAIKAVISVIEGYPLIIVNRRCGLIAKIEHLPYESEKENE